ncbi:MAG: hypothetical protein UX93_C0002G0178 [Microgenomates group bacterium GW2011_GWC1_47_20]|uniref:tRNA threonylcarbamoyladenosine biosynthesis protein TsaE n=1 Tax=Candidatus Amesbacteria bacterium GW2011_GWC2_45_19 TaxID=1618366 RepID=A0A0G1M3Q3_9BACT|nr:MAG: hypothetical protein UX05_C0009G0043 [Candidatus Amesbacteria bacterium GW2011_GWC2_45_19]KKU69339.1 MAG: hypothetical protein UX93_C0002G0178 [Microgenomates group bacterium GW2011_GWC1_47_20]
MASCIFKRNEIKKIAREILALHPNVIALTGPLGAGKTTLTKAIAKELGIKDIVVSPTFILHREYPGLDHIDAWRVEDFSEIERLGLIEMIKNKHLVIIEWADKFRKQISNLKSQATIVWVKLNYGEKENERRIEYEDISN